jgi:hypothetical protein
MQSLFNQTDVRLILDRLDRLQPEAVRVWGKMTVSQMLAHCSEAMEVATGKKKYRRVFMGRILGPYIKKMFIGEKPFPKDSPTDKHFIIRDEPDFATQKARLVGLIREFSDGGREKCTTHPHAFFGKLAPEEWAISMYKHLDHHFRQFGV